MYLALYKMTEPGTYTGLVHIWSNLPSDYPQQIQDYLDATQDPDCDLHDPLFPWESAEVVAMYRGLAKEAEETEQYRMILAEDLLNVGSRSETSQGSLF